MRALLIAASVAAALGAGAVASDAQSPRDPAPALALAGCDGALPAPTAGTPATAVKFDGIAGDFAVDQFRIGAGTPGGHRPLVLGKPIDKASPQLLARLVAGMHIPKLTLTQPKLKYTLTDVTVVDVEHTGRVAANGDRVCLTYAQGEIEYTPENPNGSPGAPVKAQF